jgi:hypothetical protein
MVSHTVYYSQSFMSATDGGDYKAKAEEAQKGSFLNYHLNYQYLPLCLYQLMKAGCNKSYGL